MLQLLLLKTGTSLYSWLVYVFVGESLQNCPGLTSQDLSIATCLHIILLNV